MVSETIFALVPKPAGIKSIRLHHFYKEKTMEMTMEHKKTLRTLAIVQVVTIIILLLLLIQQVLPLFGIGGIGGGGQPTCMANGQPVSCNSMPNK